MVWAVLARAWRQRSDTLMRSGCIGPLHGRGPWSASRLSRDRALLALRLPEPRRAGFVPVGLRSRARAQSAPPASRLRPDFTALDNLLPRRPRLEWAAASQRRGQGSSDQSRCPLPSFKPPARTRCVSSKPPAEIQIDA